MGRLAFGFAGLRVDLELDVVDDTLAKEDNHPKDKELSFQELDAIQDHLLADNLSNKNFS